MLHERCRDKHKSVYAPWTSTTPHHTLSENTSVVVLKATGEVTTNDNPSETRTTVLANYNSRVFLLVPTQKEMEIRAILVRCCRDLIYEPVRV